MSYQITWNGLTLGGASEIYKLRNVSGLHDSPGVRTSDMDRARQHGQFAGLDYLTGRSIQASVYVLSDDPADWAAFSNAMTVANSAESTLTVSVPNLASGRTLNISAKCRKVSMPVELDNQFGIGKADIEWWATDPRMYDSTLSSVTVAPSTPTGLGLLFDATFDLSFGGGAPTGAVVALNNGNFPAPWTVTFDGPLTTPKIENTATGDILTFNGTVPAGSQLVVSSLDRTVLLNGSSRYSWLVSGSKWFNLPTGTQQLRLTASGGTGTATLTYRSTWI